MSDMEILKAILDAVNSVQKDTAGLKQEISELKQEMSEFKQEMSELKQEMGELKQEMGELKQEMGELKQEMNEVKERVTKLEESNLEIKVQLDKLRADIQVIGEAHQMSFAHAMEAETLAKTVRAQQEMQNIRLNRIECDIERFKLRMEM